MALLPAERLTKDEFLIYGGTLLGLVIIGATVLIIEELCRKRAANEQAENNLPTGTVNSPPPNFTLQ